MLPLLTSAIKFDLVRINKYLLLLSLQKFFAGSASGPTVHKVITDLDGSY